MGLIGKSVDYETWCNETVEELNVIHDSLMDGIGADVVVSKSKQYELSVYAGRLAEIGVIAEKFYKRKLAEQILKVKHEGVSPMLAGRVAEGSLGIIQDIYSSTKKLEKAIDVILMSIASRFKFEKASMFMDGNYPG